MKANRKFRGSTLVKLALAAVIVLALVLAVQVIWALVIYPPEYVFRVLRWGQSDAFDWQKFPSHALDASPQPYAFEMAEDPAVAAQLAALAGVDDWDVFLAKNQTQAFLVIQDGRIIYQGYFNGARPDSIVTSFSVAKSFTSALVGIAIGEGAIRSVDDRVTDYLPELAARDARFERSPSAICCAWRPASSTRRCVS